MKNRCDWVMLLLVLKLTSAQHSSLSQAPPQTNLNFENLPNTTFSCEGKVVGGYYADVETNCQMFHVCTLGQKGETQDIKFLCLQGTVFDQRTRVCERDEEVDCRSSANFYDINKELYHDSNEAHLEFDSNITDSVSEASVTHVFLPQNIDYDDTERYEAASATGGGGIDTGFSSEGALSTRTVHFRGRTRSEVPLFNPRRTEPRSTHSLSLPKIQPFSRFRQTRRFGADDVVSSLSSAFSAASSTLSPSIASRVRQVTPSIPVPLIPVKDPDQPRVVVTNGKPFVPRLDATDSVPARQTESEYHPLALPDTNFTCTGKVSGGHYADPETDCRMFHICVMGPNETITDYKLLCGNNTVFEQKSRTCQETAKVDCASSIFNYYVNNHLIVPEWLEQLSKKRPVGVFKLGERISAAQSKTDVSIVLPPVDGDAGETEPPPVKSGRAVLSQRISQSQAIL